MIYYNIAVFTFVSLLLGGMWQRKWKTIEGMEENKIGVSF